MILKEVVVQRAPEEPTTLDVNPNLHLRLAEKPYFLGTKADPDRSCEQA
jgi:hypothetical protein